MNAIHTPSTQVHTDLRPLDFTLPPEREASEPPEARGLRRDEVRLLVSETATDRITHSRFTDIGAFLQPGDLLIINTSGTRPSALPALRADGTPLVLHLSTHRGNEHWAVEVRRPDLRTGATLPFREAVPGETLVLPDGGRVSLLAPHGSKTNGDGVRLWDADLRMPEALEAYLSWYARPIHYGYVPQDWPIEMYQTVYATEMGSAEMPSAGRAFTPELMMSLVARGIQVAPLILHTGVASLEDHEPPYAEFYRVPIETARLVNAGKIAGKRVIAVGTTVVRALETVTDDSGIIHSGEGWTEEIISPERGVRAVNGLLTGFHEPKATHLSMLEAFAGRAHLRRVYDAALREGYLWHEFGDLHLLM